MTAAELFALLRGLPPETELYLNDHGLVKRSLGYYEADSDDSYIELFSQR